MMPHMVSSAAVHTRNTLNVLTVPLASRGKENKGCRTGHCKAVQRTQVNGTGIYKL